MPELRERFGAVDGLDAPDLWGEASRRATDEVPERRVGVGPVVPWSRLGTIAVAFAVFVAAVVFAWDVATPDRPPRPEPAIDLAAELPFGWSELPAPPEVRTDAASVWTGSELLVWGGHRYEEGFGEGPLARGGLSFDAASRRWRTFPQGPLSERRDPAVAWTGSELLVWGGSTGECCLPSGEDYLSDGAAFDPRTASWRALPPAPIDGRIPFSVWTGDELLVWGNAEWGFTLGDGAAYDPATDAWRTIAEAPADINDGSAVWTGEEMIVFGAARRSSAPLTETAIGIAYAPSSDRWRELPPSDLSPNAMTAAWLGGELVAWDYLNQSQAYAPETDRWRALGRVPLDPVECPPDAVSTADVIVGDYCGSTVAFSHEDGGWRREPLPIRGCCRLNELVSAGDVVLVLSSAVEREALEPGARRLFAYHPPQARADRLGEVVDPEPFVPPTHRDGDRVVMPITFPDGSEARLSYPAALDLATLGVQPSVSYVWKANPPPRFPLRFLHDPNASIARHVEGTEPVGAIGSVEVWKARGNDVERRFWLRYRLPTWTVLVSVRDALDSAEAVAASLLLRETASGFPIALASGPIELSTIFGEGEGPEVSIGSVDGIVSIAPEGCRSDGAGDLAASRQHFSRCFDDRVAFTVAGEPSFVVPIAEGVEIEASWPVEPVPFVPDGATADAVTRVPVTFPNGATATVVYPSRFSLVSYGVQPDDAWVVPGEVGPTPILFAHGPEGVERNFVVGGAAVTEVAGPSGGTLPVWRALRISGQVAPTHWIVHRLGSWAVLVGLPDVSWAEEAATSIEVVLDTTGMPWIRTSGRIEPSGSAGEGGGAQLTIGDLDPTPRSLRPVSDAFVVVELDPFGCRVGSEESSLEDAGRGYASLCLGDGTVSTLIEGEWETVVELAEGLQVEGFEPA